MSSLEHCYYLLTIFNDAIFENCLYMPSTFCRLGQTKAIEVVFARGGASTYGDLSVYYEALNTSSSVSVYGSTYMFLLIYTNVFFQQLYYIRINVVGYRLSLMLL